MLRKYPIFGIAPGYLMACFIIISVMAPYGCKRGPFDGLKEGTVIYDVVVEGGDNINPMMQAMSPTEATCYFTGDKSCMVFSGPMNMMEARMISNAVDYTYTTAISVMGKKMAMVFDKEKIVSNYASKAKLKMNFTEETKEIAGITCKKVLVTDSTNHTYPVYYTGELAIREPNWNNPFREIDGVLMEFSMRFAGMQLKMKAREIVNEIHDPAIFEIPDGYEIIENPADLQFNF